MEATSELQIPPQPVVMDVESTPGAKANALVREYLHEHLPIYRELREIKKEVSTEEGEAYFQRQRNRADNANEKTKKAFFVIMRNIGREIDAATSALTITRRHHKPRHSILDLGMAPGGFSLAALQRNPSAILRGLSLPPSQGGHEMMIRRKWSVTKTNAQIFVEFRDVTLLWEEMGVDKASIPAEHPDAETFSSDRPFSEQKFDIVFCDGHVLRTHERGEHREKFEATRLLTSQLVLALQRIRSGGNMIVLLHRADNWPSVKLIHMFSRFSDSVELFKPLSGHRMQSSFYMVAKGVRPLREEAVQAVKEWKTQWKEATFPMGNLAGMGEEFLGCGEEEKAKAVLEEFGDALVRMTGPIFETRAAALRFAPWMKKSGRTLTPTDEAQRDTIGKQESP
ncbi:S-adenosyl-L-methionine-dependent methyltransferase-like protein [Cladorrhinum sp. PSN332]|nr:S-adenosyl-L-methionine-dependent methyltransferase-like protein [Cladorrhinum sp. PSN332]